MKNLLRALLVVVASLSVLAIYFWQHDGLRYFSVQSDSMTPSLKVGDLVVDKRVALNSLKIGQIISYVSPADQNLIISHRIIAIDATNGQVTTQGDNLMTADPPVTARRIVGSNILTVPLLGYILDTLKNPLGLVMLIYIPVAVLALIELRQLAKSRPYRHANFS